MSTGTIIPRCAPKYVPTTSPSRMPVISSTCSPFIFATPLLAYSVFVLAFTPYATQGGALSPVPTDATTEGSRTLSAQMDPSSLP